jgi:hypothetical protein
MLTIVFFPGLLAALSSNSSTDGRETIAVFVYALIVTTVCVWVGTTIAESFEIKSFIRRTLIHLYALVSLASFAIFAGLVSKYFALIQLSYAGRQPFTWELPDIVAMLATGPISTSIFYVEHRRRLADAAKVNAVNAGDT